MHFEEKINNTAHPNWIFHQSQNIKKIPFMDWIDNNMIDNLPVSLKISNG